MLCGRANMTRFRSSPETSALGLDDSQTTEKASSRNWRKRCSVSGKLQRRRVNGLRRFWHTYALRCRTIAHYYSRFISSKKIERKNKGTAGFAVHEHACLTAYTRKPTEKHSKKNVCADCVAITIRTHHPTFIDFIKITTPGGNHSLWGSNTERRSKP